MDERQRNKKAFVGDLPQWNSKFRFSAQKLHTTKETLHATPGLGQPRRVPVAGASAAAGGRVHNADPKGTVKAPAGSTTPQDADKTPTVCLFERFERLTLGTTPSTAPNTAAAGQHHGTLPAAAAATANTLGASSSTSTADSADSEQCARRLRPARRSVAFGTPCVLAYTPAGPVSDEGDGAEGRTPLWSNAGHTPYSLPGSNSASKSQACDYAEDEDSDTDCPLITTGGVQRGRASRHSGVCMELFTSVIHELPQEGAEHTPVGPVALQCPRTPLEPTPAVGGAEQPLALATSGMQAAAAVGLDDGSECSEYDDCSEADMELQTPASLLSGRYRKPATATGVHKGPGAGHMAAAADADSPSGGSSFTGFAGGALSAQQAGSVTPTLFDCSSRPPASSVQQLLAGHQQCRAGSGSSNNSSSAVEGSTTVGGTATSVRRCQAAADSLDAGKGAARVAAAAGCPPAAELTPQHATACLGKCVTPATGLQRRVLFETPQEPTAAAGGDGGVGSTSMSLRPPATTPKSKLRQPERVAVEGRTHVPTELSKLLNDADAAAAAAAALLGRSEQQGSSMLGSCEVLSPVRARRHAKQTLGASDQVLTPVRRSARKVVKGTQVVPISTTAAVVQPMLEATNYCYQPNEALQQ